MSQKCEERMYAILPMTHPKEIWDVCAYTDASQNHWGAIITQLAPEELFKPRDE